MTSSRQSSAYSIARSGWTAASVVARGRGLIVSTVAWDRDRYIGGFSAREYGFTDVDGRRVPPFIVPPFHEVVGKFGSV